MFTKNDRDEVDGHHLICLDFGPDWHIIDFDVLVRILCYIGRHAGEISDLATGIEFEVIPLRWHHFGKAYPCLASAAHAMGCAPDIRPRIFKLEEQLTEFIKTTGMDKLVEMSDGETMTWADIHDPDEG